VAVSESALQSPLAVPFLDLGPSHAELAGSLLEDIAALIDSGAFINGPAVTEFEEAFAAYCGNTHSVGVASGLDALRLALIAAGVESGDRVIVPAHTFIATFEAVAQAGGIPVPVDVSSSDYNLDVEAVRDVADESTRFIVPVHLYGQLADMSGLHDVARRFDIAIIEDAAQAHGARREGASSGSGRAAAFSFYPGKNLGAMGDAGAVVTDDEELARVVRALREHGQTAKYKHELEGWTSRLDTIQAIALLHKLSRLDGWNQERRQIAAAYTEGLAGIGELLLPQVARESEPVWHLYVIRTARRDELASFLRDRGIHTGVHYPDPPHLTPPYAKLGYSQGSFPVAEALAREVLSLPIFPGMTDDQTGAVIESIVEYFGRG
jgi:dTDP-3-amino-3,4,6-trideoxy-alpha-D-glucose transaminase